MACTASLVCLVSTVSGCHKAQSEKQALVLGTKQSKHANKADGQNRLTGHLGLPNLFQANLLCFVLATGALVLLKLICVVEPSTFIRYLCYKLTMYFNTLKIFLYRSEDKIKDSKLQV
jgi:hypothetical protein